MIELKFFDCRIEIKFSFFALLAFCGVFAGFAGGAAVFSATVLHEISHLSVLLCFHAPPKYFIISALGCRMIMNNEKRISYFQNVFVTLSGPLGNLLLFLFSVILGYGKSLFALSCLTLGLFHLFPIVPLDGGLALYSLLRYFFDNSHSRIISYVISIFFLIPIATMGFLILLRTGYNFSLFAVSVYLIFYLVLKREDLNY